MENKEILQLNMFFENIKEMYPTAYYWWQTLKADVLAQQTNNTGSPKLPLHKEYIKHIQSLFGGLNERDHSIATSAYTYFERHLRAGALSDNKQSVPVCPHARLKWSVYDCTIKNSFALDLMDCNGEGTYSIPGNSGFGYSHQCNKVPGKPAHVG